MHPEKTPKTNRNFGKKPSQKIEEEIGRKIKGTISPKDGKITRKRSKNLCQATKQPWLSRGEIERGR